jgi:hypothetical protein
LTRAQIRTPFDGEIISPKTRLSDTIDNVKAKIDNMKAKTQDEEDPGPRSRPSLVRRLVPDQLGASPTSSLPDGPPPTSLRLAREVSASHDNFPPRTRSLCPARAPPTPTGAWATTCGTTPGCGRLHHYAWGIDSLRHATTPAGPNRSLNAGLLSCTAIPSPSSPTLSYASFARGTQAPPTTSSDLRLGLNVAG